MSAMAWFIVAIIIVPCSVMVWAVISVDRPGLAAVRSNLGRGRGKAADDSQGVEAPWLVQLGQRLTPKGYPAWLDKLLAKAGRPAAMPLDRLLVIKPALALVAGVVGILLMLKTPTGTSFLLTLFVTVLAYFVPDLLLRSQGAKRQEAIELELPSTLDQMLISVEAGLGFESAMARAGQNGKGPLAAELLRTLQDMQVGRSRREAYLAMGQRTGAPDLRSFVRAVVQADVYGIAIASVLRTQAKQMRIKRKQRAEEKAMKLPIKVLFPLMLCILPVLFIVILGPAVINIIAAFSGM
ncbi:type II secretion system F family protein [Pseudarthrobacter sp. H3Y2-7]|uniref:type II secretion system F family protein n=1 Tax=Pseudarthrobacter naphthalenicus TaxID=3031328 RepID=UPI0023AED97E|nr:type II secretion system F family protein [Pseudarthrobacter sp. H3Y2-7]MDE8667135.1 type II secretion system F family protein [Pseudarthrobacter sp. H3Y2-7]